MISPVYFMTIASAIAATIKSSGNEVFKSAHELASRDNTYNSQAKYSVLTQYFQQDDPNTDQSNFDISQNLGLESSTSWSQLISDLQDYNNQSPNDKYKLIFLQRHGEGWHNVAPDFYGSAQWECYWQILNGNGTVEWYDAELTPNGVSEIKNMKSIFSNAISHNGAPVPQSYYVSPLRRTLETWNILWTDLASGKPTIKELARETYGIGTDSKRHNKEYIAKNYPFAQFEDNFSQFDTEWDQTQYESSDHRKYRANALLDEIFTTDNSNVVSLVAHGGFIKSVLKVIGHRKWSLGTGEMVPVVIKAQFDKQGDSYDTSNEFDSQYVPC